MPKYKVEFEIRQRGSAVVEADSPMDAIDEIKHGELVENHIGSDWALDPDSVLIWEEQEPNEAPDYVVEYEDE